jgi:hypothetical protein
MNDLYFACKWIPNLDNIEYLRGAIGKAKELGCNLVFFDGSDSAIDDYWFTICAIQVPSEGILNEFIHNVGKDLGLSDWYPISDTEFSKGYTLDSATEPEAVWDWQKALYADAMHNTRQFDIKQHPEKYHYDKPIEGLNLSPSVEKALMIWGYTAIGDILDVLQRGQTALLKVRGFNEQSLQEVLQKLREQGYLPLENNHKD